jgi:hypothetical protein
MPGPKVTTDMGDWSTIPQRLRLAFVTVVLVASLVGIAAGTGLLSVPVAVILLTATGLACLFVFDRRRAWWPEEPGVAADPIGRHMRRNVAILAAAGLGALVLGVILVNQPPTFSCSTPNAKACTDTEASIRGDMSFVFAEDLPGRLVAVDVRPAPSGWEEGDWAAVLTVEGREPMLMQCYYTSDEMVGCNRAP